MLASVDGGISLSLLFRSFFCFFLVMTLTSSTWVDRPVLSFLDFPLSLVSFYSVGLLVCACLDDDDDGLLRLYVCLRFHDCIKD